MVLVRSKASNREVTLKGSGGGWCRAGVEPYDRDRRGEEELGTSRQQSLLRGPVPGVQLAAWAPMQDLQLPCALKALPGAVVPAMHAVPHLSPSRVKHERKGKGKTRMMWLGFGKHRVLF